VLVGKQRLEFGPRQHGGGGAQQQGADANDAGTRSDVFAGNLKVPDKLVMGGPPECKDRDTCFKGLQDADAADLTRFLRRTGAIAFTVLALASVAAYRQFAVNAMFTAPQPRTEERMVRGLGVSPGVYEGTARVIRGTEEFGRIEQGAPGAAAIERLGIQWTHVPFRGGAENQQATLSGVFGQTTTYELNPPRTFPPPFAGATDR
jgi:hypothetical protein